MVETDNLLKVLQTIAEKMSVIVPILQNIETKLAMIENEKNSDISDIKNSLDIVKGCVLANPTLSMSSDQFSLRVTLRMIWVWKMSMLMLPINMSMTTTMVLVIVSVVLCCQIQI